MIKKFLKDPKIYFISLLGRVLRGSIWADKIYLSILFRYRLKRKLDFKNPKTYNEKLQWMKIYDKNPLYSKLADKYEVRKYIANKIGEEYLIPLIGVWNSFDEIDFDKMPNEFILKCTHDSGSVIICTDKNSFDKKKARKKFNHWMKRNYYINTREWPYKDIEPKIIAEKLIGEKGKAPIDYKFYCFNGVVDCVMLCLDRESGNTNFCYLSRGWKKLPYAKDEFDTCKDKIIYKPKSIDKMFELAEKLCKPFKSVRIDMYFEDDKIYFGEITFFNQSGFDADLASDIDEKWGNMINLKEV